MLRYIVRILLVLSVLYGIVVGGIYILQPKIVFQPDPLVAEHNFNFEEHFEEFYLYTDDSIQINALYFSTPHVKKGAVLYLHGNADNLQRWGQYQTEFTKRGYDALVIDYRGYGKSDGAISEAGLYQDAQAAYQWLLQKYEPEEIIIYGRSLGTGVASWLASKVKARMLLLETPFDNMTNVLHAHLPNVLLPFDIKYKFPNDEYLKAVAYSIYIFHGTEDEIVPYESAMALQTLLKEHDEFITIEGGQHRGLRHFPIYQETMDRLLGINEFEPNLSVE